MDTIRRRMIESLVIGLILIAVLAVIGKSLAWLVSRFGIHVLANGYTFAIGVGLVVMLAVAALYVDTRDDKHDGGADISGAKLWLLIAGLVVFIAVLAGADIVNLVTWLLERSGDSPPPPPKKEFDFSQFEFPSN